LVDFVNGEAHAPRRLGIFGGTFDPPHIGHLVAANEVRVALDLDLMLLVVAALPWQKAGLRALSPPADRFALVEAAVREVDGLEASSLEIERGGPSYTADTLEALHRRSPPDELFVVLGADAAAGIDSWERPGRVAELATLVVVDRPGAWAAPPARFRYERVAIPAMDVSSTDLRRRVAAGRPIDFLTAHPVVTSIAERHLYRVAE
jgi:nicotinate-nucleotide adenylyltransferase